MLALPMHRSIAHLLAALVALVASSAGAFAADSACIAVARAASPLVPVAFSRSSIPPGHVGLTFLGHASFLIESPGGITAVTDYNGFIRPDFVPDIVTMNHAHSTHYTDFPDPGIKLVLRGWDPAGGVPHHDVSLGDVHVHNVPTNIRDWSGGTEYAGNSIFVFDVAGLCIAHLGHLHHTLTPEHLAELGPVDVLLVPVDGTWTLSHEDMIEVIESIRPALIVPMHYFNRQLLETFLAKLGEHYPVHTNPGPATLLSRSELPKQTEILVLPGN